MNRMKPRYAALIIALAGGYGTAFGQAFAGRVNWMDGAGLEHAARRVKVEVWGLVPNADGDFINTHLATTMTDQNGDYLATASGGVAHWLMVYPDGPAGTVVLDVATSDPTPVFGGAGGPMVIGNSSDAERSFAVYDALYTGYYFGTQARPGPPAPLLTRFPWTGSPATSHFSPGAGQIRVLSDDRWDWDVLLHEYSHYIGEADDLDDSPGGRHFFGVTNIGQADPRLPLRDKAAGTRLAWGEGLGNFLGVAMQQVNTGATGQNMPVGMANIGDDHYQDTIDLAIDFSLESHFGSGEGGEGEEVSVARILWDIADPSGGADGAKDRVSKGFVELYEILDTSVTSPAGGPRQLQNVWNYFTGGGQPDSVRADFGAIFEEYGVSPRPVGGMVGGSVMFDAPAPTFDWTPQNNGANETFGLIIFDDAWNRLLTISVPGVDATSYTLSGAEWATLSTLTAGGPEDFKFIVNGWDLLSPTYEFYLTMGVGGGPVDANGAFFATGGYWSDVYGFTVVPTPGSLALGACAAAMLRRRRHVA
ncbi:hypothetical protein PHYC_01703 [Phycisphaerales bacterium]|nr:hypothetical protein PHYC_01703 [Phycisphaerales bacterium]